MGDGVKMLPDQIQRWSPTGILLALLWLLIESRLSGGTSSRELANAVSRLEGTVTGIATTINGRVEALEFRIRQVELYNAASGAVDQSFRDDLNELKSRKP